jgi:phosphomannomutase
MPVPIQFGTSGWRGLIARDFTFDNVRVAACGVSQWWRAELDRPGSPVHGRKPVVILGHDTRFLGREFALAVAEVLSASGLQPWLCERDTPTPVIAHSIRKRRAIGGVNMTASHNPAEYQGFKFSLHNGAGAPPEVTREVEANIRKLQQDGWTFHGAIAGTYPCKTFNPAPDYFAQVRRLIDFDAIRKARLKVAAEFMYGTGRGYLDTLLEEDGGARVLRFHDTLNPSFGGHHPEPNEEGMSEARQAILAGKAQIGLGLDGDADRFGIVDRDGTWLAPNQVLALALHHLRKNRGWTGAVVRTVPTSHQVDAVARLLGVRVHETPVGFKYIGALMESEPIIVGGEESGGLSVKGHVPEKDGILACLLMAELVAVERRPLGAVLAELAGKAGEFHTGRINVAVPAARKEALLERLSRGLERFAGKPVREFITKDGFKFVLPDDEWVAFRASGTEPLIRCYLEAKSPDGLRKLAAAARKVLAA